MPGVPLVLDVDTGVDDALAILYAASSPDAELLACTCVMGNVMVEQAVENTLAVLELAGLPEVEVARGAGRPVTRGHEPFPLAHGEHGLGRATPPPAARAASERSAVRLIVDVARERPGQVLLVATGPLTNVAMALEEEPRLPELLGGFALMGGAYAQHGNATPAAEANIWTDPEAGSAVFRGFSGRPVDHLPICVGLDVTEGALMSRTDLDDVCRTAPSSPLARFLQEAVAFYIEFHEQTGVLGGASMHDSLAVAVALDESLARLETTRVEVETEGRWTAGMTVADLRGIRTQPWAGEWKLEDNARVALDVDGDAFMARFLGRLRDLVSARAGAGG
jgi:purine nucleosidase